MTGFLKLFITGASALALTLAIGVPAYAQNIEGSAIINAEVDDVVDVGLEGNADASLEGTIDETSREEGEMSGVRTNDDFNAYAASTVQNNEEIKTVDATDTSVSVGFIEEAKLFGVFPVSLKSHVVVHADGAVKVVRPWYSVFAFKSDAYETTTLETELAGLLAQARTESGQFTAEGKAMVTQTIVNSLVGKSDTTVDAAGGTVLEGSAPMPGIDASVQ